MATKTEDKKIYEPEYIEEEPLPEAVIWAEIIDAPQSVAELNPADGQSLANATAAIDGLGALAYEDLVTELQLADEAVTNAKIAVDAIQGDVIAASAITGVKISDDAISAAKIQAGAITAGKIAAGSIVANDIAASTITASKMNVSNLSSLSANLGTINAGSISAVTISGSTITGTTLSTATSGQRVVLTTTLASFYNASGTLIMSTYADSNSYLIKGQQSASSIFLDSGSSGTTSLLSNGTIKMVFDMPNNRVYSATNGQVDLGVSGGNFKNVQHNGIHIYQGTDMPLVYWLQIESGSIDEGNDPGWSISNPATGKYTITHNLGHTRYACLATAIRGSGAGAYAAKIESYSTSSVTVTVFNDSGIAAASDFMFALFEDPN